jgi:hypothetical protein
MDSTFTPIGSAYFKKSKIEEIEVWRSRSFKKSKFEEAKDIWSRRLKKSRKSKIEAFEDGWMFEVWRLNPSLQLELSLGGYWRGYALRVPAN